MSVVHFNENNEVDVRYLWATSVQQVVEKLHGPVWRYDQRIEEVDTGEREEDGAPIIAVSLHVDAVRLVAQSVLDAFAQNYAVGAYHVGSTRDPVTLEVTNYQAPDKTTSERAAHISMASSDFWIALHLALIHKGILTYSSDVQAYTISAINSAVSAKALTPQQGLEARTLVRTAVTFHRNDPQRPGLLDAVGAILGLTSEEVDDVFVGSVVDDV